MGAVLPQMKLMAKRIIAGINIIKIIFRDFLLSDFWYDKNKPKK
jgi:hypothetical protein